MQEKLNVTLKLLEIDERRSLLAAAKELTEMRVSSVTTDFGIAAPNFYAFLADKGNAIGVGKQLLVLKNYGFGASGELLDYLHSWFISSDESFGHLRACLTYEIEIADVKMSKVKARLNDLEFMGLCVEFQSLCSDKSRRIVLTMNCQFMSEDEFINGVIYAIRSTPDNVVWGEDLVVGNLAAREVWRWKYGNRRARRMPFRIPPKIGLLEYDFPIFSDEGVIETAESLLALMAPRFEKLSQDNAKLRNIKQSSWDISLAARSKKTLENI